MEVGADGIESEDGMDGIAGEVEGREEGSVVAVGVGVCA